ncbi:hypothetical protein CEXT_129371 [Caerostris extrusa]|uniref:Uncharacterized protein n=1 Tax=Caerostris extrusa TaxID=172846 RepID=A0AAV4XK52_CAEEX|nr:hypothetical protein CEXT_129371 [Caerostris extrusa]
MSSKSSLTFLSRVPESQGRCSRKVQNATYERICRTTLIPRLFKFSWRGFLAFYYLRQIHPDRSLNGHFVIEQSSCNLSNFLIPDLKIHYPNGYMHKTPSPISRNQYKNYKILNKTKTKISSKSSLAFPKPRLQRARADVLEKSRIETDSARRKDSLRGKGDFFSSSPLLRR